MAEIAARIAENVTRLRQRIAEAAARRGAAAEEITLVAVTKYVGLAEVRALVEAGCRLLGESRPQQLWQKAEALAEEPIGWHMIGQLQRNKVRRTLPLVEMVQSVDSLRLARSMDRIAAELGRRVPILLEVNTSGEAAKSGFEPAAVGECLEELAACANIEVRGLMCMAGLAGGLSAARGDFARLRQLRDRLRGDSPDGVSLDELSMGMSGDFEVAIEEGATIVRVGSALFEGIL